MKRLVSFIFLFLIVAQARGEVSVQSNAKKAKVYSLNGEGVRQLLGETPLKVESVPTGILLVEKEGYVPTQILLSPGVENAEMKVDLRPLSEWSPEYMRLEASRIADKALDRIVSAQALLDERKIETARPIITSLLQDFPSSVAVRILHANLLALSGKASEALEAYGALSKDLGPKDLELKKLVDRMVEGLKKIVAKRKGA